jgi:hypothetical protein
MEGNSEKSLRRKIVNQFDEFGGYDINNIMSLIKDYERKNIEQIGKLQKKRTITIRKIVGGLKQTINAHGPISKEFIGSAAKRIYGAMINDVNPKNKNKPHIQVLECILYLVIIVISIIMLINKLKGI